MNFILSNKDLLHFLQRAEKELLQGNRTKFEITKKWRESKAPNFPGVYALFEDSDSLLYIGETGNLRERMSDICRTVNHTFRKQLGHKRFGAIKTKKKI